MQWWLVATQVTGSRQRLRCDEQTEQTCRHTGRTTPVSEQVRHARRAFACARRQNTQRHGKHMKLLCIWFHSSRCCTRTATGWRARLRRPSGRCRGSSGSSQRLGAPETPPSRSPGRPPPRPRSPACTRPPGPSHCERLVTGLVLVVLSLVQGACQGAPRCRVQSVMQM